MATSGIAGTLLPDSSTAHSVLGLPVQTIEENSVSSMQGDSEKARLLGRTDLFLWDEGVMGHRYAFNCAHRLLHQMVANAAAESSSSSRNIANAGKVFVIMGDLRQLHPVIPRGRQMEMVGATFLRASYWAQVQVLELLQLNERVAQRQ